MTDPITPQAAAPDLAGWIAAARQRYDSVTKAVGSDVDATVLRSTDFSTLLSATADVRVAVMVEEWLDDDASLRTVLENAIGQAESWEQRADRQLANVADAGPLGSIQYAESVAMAGVWNTFARGLGMSLLRP